MGTAKTPAYPITLPEFTIAFVPFATLLATALLAGETTLNPGFYRTVFTIWVAAALVTPALCAFALPGESERKRALWFLFWNFSFVAYLVHMGYAVFAAYHGSWREFIEGQGVFPAIVNVVFTTLWALDLALAWLYHGNTRWLRVERVTTHIFVGLTFVASTVVLKRGFVNVIGIAMTLSILVCLAIRWDARRKTAPPTPAARLPEGVSLGDPFRARARTGDIS